jgi:hypothetical protein
MMIPLSAGLHAPCKWVAATGSKVQWGGRIERRFAPDFCTKNPQGNQYGDIGAEFLICARLAISERHTSHVKEEPFAMTNIKPTALEIARADGELNEAQAEAFCLLCRENPELKIAEQGHVDGRTYAALVRRGLLEWRQTASEMGFAFTDRARKIWKSQREAEGDA